MPFTEFCCRSGGSNLNAGSRSGSPAAEPGTGADFTYTGGGFVTATRMFTATGTIDASIAAGDFVSIYDSALAPTVAGYIARVTGVTSTTITVSATAFAGVKPVADIVGTAVCRVGGAWLGPNAAVNFPVNFVTAVLTNVGVNPPRVNFKNDQTYSITASLAHTIAGPVTWQGYTTNYGDGGKATIDGGTTGASYVLWNPSAGGVAYHNLVDLIFQNNGATGIADGVLSGSSNRTTYINCVVHDVRGNGFIADCVSCEAYRCNQSNTSDTSGFKGVNASIGFFWNCIAHDNVGSNNCGFLPQSSTCINCISDSNGLHGFYCNGLIAQHMVNCDAYNNGGDGFRHVTQTTNLVLLNCNFFKNSGWGINIPSGSAMGYIANCVFGSSPVGNALGSINATNMPVQQLNNNVSGSLPWMDGPNGDFRINPAVSAVKGTGRGVFTESTPMTGAVTGASNATPIVITAPSRIMRTGETVVIAGVGGNTNANGTWVVTNVSATTFSLNGSAGNAAYTSGGTFSVAYSGTIGYPDIGAAQHQDAGGGGGLAARLVGGYHG